MSSNLFDIELNLTFAECCIQLIQSIRFKDMSPFCAQSGLYLASGPFSAHIRHFGLQLMEHTVKFKWNCISQQEKIFIKVIASVFHFYVNL